MEAKWIATEQWEEALPVADSVLQWWILGIVAFGDWNPSGSSRRLSWR